MSYYAVARGRIPGVYRTWAECSAQVNGFSGARYKKFPTATAAASFAFGGESTTAALRYDTVAIEPCAVPTQTSMERPTVEDASTIIAFTDGACPNNQSNATVAAWGVCFPYHAEWNASAKLPGPPFTNIRAEMCAVINAISIASQFAATNSVLIIYTDSKFCCDLVTDYIPSWKARGWTRRGGPIANLDLVKQLDAGIQSRSVRLIWIPAHTGADDFWAKWNAVADSLATEECQR